MFKKVSLINIKAQLVEFNSDLNPDDFMDLLKMSQLYQNISLSTLEKNYEKLGEYEQLDPIDKATLLDQVGEEADNVRRISSIGEELAIIGLYKTIEASIKKCAGLSGLFSEREVEKMSYINELEDILKKQKIMIDKIENYSEFNELRLINNCLKHAGEINEKLFELNPSLGGIGDKIKDSSDHFRRLINPSFNFLRKLGLKISIKMKENQESTSTT